MTEKILTFPDVIKVTKLSRSTIYRLIESGDFPEPFKLNPNAKAKGAVGWYESEINDWIASLRGRAA